MVKSSWVVWFTSSGGIYLKYMNMCKYVYYEYVLDVKTGDVKWWLWRICLIWFRELEMCVLKRLCLNEAYVYLKYDSVWIIMNVGMNFSRSQWYELWWLCGSCAHTLFEWSYEWNGGFVGYTLVMSRDPVSRLCLLFL